jgi:hypothetical protein
MQNRTVFKCAWEARRQVEVEGREEEEEEKEEKQEEEGESDHSRQQFKVFASKPNRKWEEQRHNQSVVKVGGQRRKSKGSILKCFVLKT